MDTQFLAEQVGQLLQQRGLSLGLAESCTGGLVAAYITNVAGASGYFLGGIVAYSVEVKYRLLGVSRRTLKSHGAVSAETAQEMARGARERLHVDVAVAITGIAGPTGALPGKPVGLTFMALAGPDSTLVRKYLWAGDRRANRESSARAALELLAEYLEQH
ncbi:MAG TPA: CinA family protein [Anaerolineae bacterium]|nr:CinA family protein [Anaerolineae bacterium]HNT04702.1 CinA family protein [Anaerolineae bacterium]HOU22861.1 CinA family protein [Anaerolineae bacterium]HQJ50410.1 CinA family protein [Anaerolineae bacterium]